MNSERLNKQLIKAIIDREIKKAEDFIQQGADVNARDAYGNTPLILAVQSIQPEMVKLLIDYQVDINKKGQNNKTPFFWAAYVQSTECASLLIHAGARTNKSMSIHTGILEWDKHKNQQIKTFVKKVISAHETKKVFKKITSHKTNYGSFTILRQAVCQQKLYD